MSMCEAQKVTIHIKKETVEVKKICRENDDSAEVADPQYELSFEKLNKNGKSYVLESKINDVFPLSYNAMNKFRGSEKFVGLESLVHHNAYYDVVLGRTGGTRFANESFKGKRLMEESREVDMDYSHFISSILTLAEKFGSLENDSDCYIEEENDPEYEQFLKNVKEHEKSYVFLINRAGSPGVIKYESEFSFDEKCHSEPRRGLRSEIKQGCGRPNWMPHVESQHKYLLRSTSVEMNTNLIPRKSKKEVNNQKVEAASEMVPDLDYLNFLQSTKFADDFLVFTFGGDTIVYEKLDLVKENSDDEHSSEVKIIDVTAFYKEGKSKPSVNTSPEMNEDIFQNPIGETVQSMFRQELVSVLRKPYDKEEHNKLLQDVKIRKREDRHMDLRGGRERSCSTGKVGKSYLDRYPGLRKQLLNFEDDRPKCLNLLRGFFFWLQVLNHSDF
ncbi:hypothetical protein F511_05028 [Dorcoceras hygrometricum]|uniref:Uncharacterized protein n=1 Tax=Dorcoceras hygrometricum TaxID=472368 RepID=A0A2Z7AUS9_9LAMI|nr:hypothetical protein F511_05028 [Dorcoceras hygrometricum]